MGGFSPLVQTLILTLTLAFIPFLAAEDLYRLVYKGCASSRGGAVAPSAVAALSSTLLAQAATSKFYKTTSSAAGQPVLGLFQCRGDLSSGACASCVARALPGWAEQCGPTAAAARVQLAGCYALYQVSGFPQVSGTQLLFKTCAASGGGGGGFEENRDTALSTVQGGVVAGGGFDATTYGGVYALAQCEGDLSSADCGECVAQAVQKAEVECGGAASAQVFLDKCYISYSYYPNGVPRGGGGGSGFGGGGRGGQQTGKTVAIVVGGAAAVGFLIICLLFANSLRKKKDDY